MKTAHQEQFGNEAEKKVEENKKEAAQEARKILNLKPDATFKEIKSVYRRLALWFHPDKNPDDAERANEIMARLNELYEILCDAAELAQNKDEDRFKDDAKDRDIEDLEDVFLLEFDDNFDPVMQKMIEAYQRQYKLQEERKGEEVDIMVDEVAGKGDEEPGSNVDIKT